MGRVLFSFLFLFYFSLAQQTLPRLPSAFSVDIEANLLDNNQTLNVREYYDKVAGFERYEMNSADSYTTIITDYNKREVYTIVNDVACTFAPYTPDTVLTARTTEDLNTYGDLYGVTYLGNSFNVRGVPCDSWISYISFISNGTTLSNGTVTGINWNHTFTIQYFFSVDWWLFRAVNITKKPMRAVLNGTRTSPNNQMSYAFTHNYEFVNFIPRSPSPTLFVLPTSCVPIAGQVLQLLQSTAGGGLAAGMFFLGAFIGAGITGVSIWVYCRRRQLARDRFASSSVAMQENRD